MRRDAIDSSHLLIEMVAFSALILGAVALAVWWGVQATALEAAFFCLLVLTALSYLASLGRDREGPRDGPDGRGGAGGPGGPGGESHDGTGGRGGEGGRGGDVPRGHG